jgi:beta-glucanase (GH16 family)
MDDTRVGDARPPTMERGAMKIWNIFGLVYLVTLTIFTGTAQEGVSREKTATSIQPPLGYKLVWWDEFDRDGKPDPLNWDYEIGFVRNMEFQWYQPDNARCEKGLLIIEGKREQKQNLHYKSDSKDWRESRQYSDFTSASLTTRGLHAWMYGRFEMRARIDTRAGLWPAFWTLGAKGQWPACGEIDIMEYYQGMLLGNAAWASEKPWVAQWDDIRMPITEFNDPQWSEKFHVWRMDWDTDAIKLYVDDFLLNRENAFKVKKDI